MGCFDLTLINWINLIRAGTRTINIHFDFYMLLKKLTNTTVQGCILNQFKFSGSNPDYWSLQRNHCLRW